MNSRVRIILYLVFALSGFSGLIYESIWTHYLKLFLGHAAYAQALVLAIFMGGLALGSWICSRFSVRWKRLLMGYAITEGVIGVFALFFHDVFIKTIEIIYSSIIPSLPTPQAVTIFKWTISSLLILPQTILLGMTFPLMSAALIRMFPREQGRSISLLYFNNSIGAALGVLVSGFLLIRMVGLPGTIRIAGIINLVLAVIVWLLVSKYKIESDLDREPRKPEERPAGIAWYWILLAVSLVTGTSSFIYEIGWIRMLSLVLGTSTHAFELMLSAFILGLALGGLWIKHRIDNIVNPVRFLIFVQIIMGLLALLTLPLYGNTFKVMQWIVPALSKTDIGYIAFNLLSGVVVLAIMLPTTFCAGMTLPLITCMLINKGYGERSIGAVYAANTVGAIIGVFASIHLGMPLLGLKGLITFGAGLDIALGFALLWSAASERDNNRLSIAITSAGIIAVVLTLFFVTLDPYKMASGVYRGGEILTPEKSSILYHEDGKTATVSVSLLNDGVMSIRTNGKVDAGIMMTPSGAAQPDESTMVLVAVLPLALHPGAETAANIGMGSGLTTHTLLSTNQLKQVDTIEIEKTIAEAAKNFGSRVELAYKDPRSKIYIDDAKTFFSSRHKQYDIILSEPSNPWVSGVAGLFSDEFYKLINRHLNENGLFVQWLQLYEIDLDLVASVFKAISANFLDFEVYASNFGDLLIIAGNRGVFPGLNAGLLENPEIVKALHRIHIRSIRDLEVRKIGDKKIFGKLFETFPIRANSDYYPVLDQGAARTRFLGVNAESLVGLSEEPLPVMEMLAGSARPENDTLITPTFFFPKTKAIFKAMALRDYYRTGSFKEEYSELPVEAGQDAIQLKRIFFECRAAGDQDRRIVLFNTAKSMIPYLSPQESEVFWRQLEAGPCSNSLTAMEKNYILLFKAIGNRDADAMVNASKTIIENEYDITPARLKYIVASGMLGNLAQKRREESFRLWSTYQGRMFGTSNPGLLFQLLIAQSVKD